jgi:hypothetical protein
MSTDRGSSTGVKSLRAMFENAKQPEAPTPERGRPAAGSSTPGDSVRPISKVRANFVAVELNAQLAKKIKDHTPDASGTVGELTRTISKGDQGSSDTPRRDVSSKDFDDVKSMPSMTTDSVSAASTDTTPSRLDSGTNGTSPPMGLSHVFVGMQSPKEAEKAPTPVRKPEQQQRSPPPKDVLQILAANLRTPSKPKEKAKEPPAPLLATPQRKLAERPKTAEAPTTNAAATKTNGINSRSMRPPPINIEKPNPPTPSNNSRKLPSSRPQTPMSAKSYTARPRLSTYNRAASERGGNKASTLNSTSRGKSPKPVAEKHTGTRSATGFVKPRPKSPTRPIKLPAHLIAPTASSAAKHGQSVAVPISSSNRRASMVSTSSRMSLSQSFRRDGASSFGPPPKPRTASGTSNTLKSTKVPDNSFLARMMRPTASSASKVHEKIEVQSPSRSTPRKVSQSHHSTPGKARGTETPQPTTDELRHIQEHSEHEV